MSFFQCRHKTNEHRAYFSFYLQYTAIFVVLALFIYSCFLFTGRSLLYSGDGWNQYYKAYVYYGQYLRSFVRDFLSGNISLREFDFTIGEGADILQTLHYYVIGDPFSLLLAICPVRFTYLAVNFIIIFKMYCAGITFSVLCFNLNKKRDAVLIGSFIYVFSMWGLNYSVCHPIFIPPLIYFPLIILGVEKIISHYLSEKKEPYYKYVIMYVIVIWMSAISNIYFFYMQVCLTVIYFIIRFCSLLISDRTYIKALLICLFKIVMFSCVGVLMAGVILLPLANALLTNSRLGYSYTFDLFYPIRSCIEIFGSFNSNVSSCYGLACPALLAVYLLFCRKKKSIDLKIMVIAGFIMCIMPIAGMVLNGFSYAINRWVFGNALLLSYIFVECFDEMIECSYSTIMRFTVIYCAYFGICQCFKKTRTIDLLVQTVILLFLILAILILNQNENPLKLKKRLVFFTVIISIIANAYFLYSPMYGDKVHSGIPNSKFEEYKKNESYLVNSAAQSDILNGLVDKYSGRDITQNASMFADVSSTALYWSIASPVVSNYRINDMNLMDGFSYSYIGYDDREPLLELASVKYFIKLKSDELPMPIGFSKLDVSTDDESVNSKYDIYVNNMALPCGYTYDSKVDLEEWRKLSATEKEAVSIQAVAVERDNVSGSTKDFLTDVEKVKYDLTLGDGVVLLEDGFFVNKTSSTVTMNFEGSENSKTYLQFDDLYIDIFSEYDLYFKDIIGKSSDYNKEAFSLLSREDKFDIIYEKIFSPLPADRYFSIKSDVGNEKILMYKSEDTSLYSNQHDFCINCGYSDLKASSITMTFLMPGYYRFKNLSVYCHNMSNYENQVNRLKEDVLENVRFSEDKLEGDLNLEKEKVLVVSVPYSEGWSAYIDGVKTKIYKANDIYLGLEVPAGKHKIEFQYKTPFLRLGIVLSVVGFLLLTILLVYSIVKKPRRLDLVNEYID